MADKLRAQQQLEQLQARYVGTGHADTTKFEWTSNIHRDTYASYVGHPSLLQYISVGTGEPREKIRAQLIEKMIQPVGKPPELHINLIYPFLSEPTTKVDDITRRIRSVLSGFYPFRIVFEEVRHFQHSRHSSTVYLLPSDRDRDTIDRSTKSAGGEHTKAPNTGGLQAIKALQANLQTEFAECDADPRLFTLHLSVGQSKAHQDVAMFEEEVRLVMTQFCAGKEYEDVLDTGLFHPKAEAETAKARPPADEEMSSVGGHGVGTWELEWNVDRVVMIERAGHEDPFRAVAEVELLKEQQLSQGLCIASPVRPVLENVAGQELSKTLSGMALRLLYSRPQYGRKPPG